MTTLVIHDLTSQRELDRFAMTAIAGGIYRTPPQILAGQVTHQPATWNGMVLGDDGQLHVPVI